MNSEKYPWNDNGLNLLLVFNQLINEYGGAEVLARKIEWESKEFFGVPVIAHVRLHVVRNKKKYSIKEDQFIKDNWHSHTLRYLAHELNRCMDSVARRGYLLGMDKKPLVREHWFLRPAKRIANNNY